MPEERIAASTTGTLEVRVTASGAAIEKFGRLDLALTWIAIRQVSDFRDEKWTEYPPGATPVNLADQIGGHATSLMRQEVPAGPYEAIRIGAGPATGRLHDGRTPRLKVSIDPVRVRFDVRPGGTTSVVLDFRVEELRKGPRGAFDYEIRIMRAFADPPGPTRSGFLPPPHRHRLHPGEPDHGLRDHLEERSQIKG